MLGRMLLHDLLEDEDMYDSEEFEEELQEIYMLMDLEQMRAASVEAVLEWDPLEAKGPYTTAACAVLSQCPTWCVVLRPTTRQDPSRLGTVHRS